MNPSSPKGATSSRLRDIIENSAAVVAVMTPDIQHGLSFSRKGDLVSCRGHHATGDAGARGSRTVKTAPAPGALATVIVPPSPRRSAVTYSPSPSPPKCRLRRRARTARRSAAVFGRHPYPVVLDLDRRLPPSAPTRTSMGRPAPILEGVRQQVCRVRSSRAGPMIPRTASGQRSTTFNRLRVARSPRRSIASPATVAQVELLALRGSPRPPMMRDTSSSASMRCPSRDLARGAGASRPGPRARTSRTRRPAASPRPAAA